MYLFSRVEKNRISRVFIFANGLFWNISRVQIFVNGWKFGEKLWAKKKERRIQINPTQFLFGFYFKITNLGMHYAYYHHHHQNPDWNHCYQLHHWIPIQSFPLSLPVKKGKKRTNQRIFVKCFLGQQEEKQKKNQFQWHDCNWLVVLYRIKLNRKNIQISFILHFFFLFLSFHLFFFRVYFANHWFQKNFVCIYFREWPSRKFRVHLILRNWPKFAKISTLKVSMIHHWIGNFMCFLMIYMFNEKKKKNYLI